MTSTRRNALLGAVALASVAIIIGFLSEPWDQSVDGDLISVHRGGQESYTTTDTSLTSIRREPTEPDHSRREVQLTPRRLRVLSSSGEPLTGALATITSVNAAEQWSQLDIGEQISQLPHTFEGKTSKDGTLELPPPGELGDSGRQVLWITHPTHLATWRELSDPDLQQAHELEIPLGPRRSLEVKVTKHADDWSEPILVLQTGVHLASRFSSSEPLSANDAARLTLARLSETTSEGRCALPQFAFESAAQAVSGSSMSLRRPVVPSRSTMTMKLETTFSLRGSANCWTGESEGTAILSVLASTGQGLDLCAEIRVDLGNAFGPLSVPLPPADTIHVTLSGECGAAQQEELQNVLAGEMREVHFRLPEVPESWFRAVGHDGRPLEGALISASWLDGDLWLQREGITDEEGLCRLEGIGSPQVTLTASLEARATAKERMVSSYLERSSAPTIFLPSGRSISGRVLLGEVPADDFAVIVWGENSQNSQVFRFFDRPNGSFEIAGIETGEINLLAAGIGMSASPTLALPPGDQHLSNVELVCSAAGQLDIVTVDSKTGSPISGASIFQHPVAGRHALFAVAGDQITDTSGLVTFEDFSCSETAVSVGHPDYTKRTVLLPAVKPGATRQRLVIAVNRTKQLRVELYPWPHDLWDLAWVGLRGSAERDLEQVSDDGAIEFEAVDSGQLEILVVFPDSMMMTWEGALLPGEAETIRIYVGEEQRLDVFLEDKSAFKDLRIVCEYAAQQDGAPPFTQRAIVNEDGLTQLRGLPKGDGIVRLSLDDGTYVAERVVSASDLESGRVTLSSGTHSIEVLVQDANGEPVPGVYVYAVPNLAPMELSDWSTSGRNGRATIQRSGRTPSRVLASTGSRHSDVHWFDPSAKQADPLVLELPDPVEVQFTAPGAGSETAEVQWNLYVEEPRLWIGQLSTAFTHESSPGSYFVQLKTPGLWLDEQLIEIPTSGGLVEIKVRRLGALSVVPLGADAVALDTVQLIDTLDNQSSDDRLARSTISRVELEGGGFEFGGLPCGEYEWSARFTDGLVRAGRVRVAPDTRTTLEIARE